MQTIDVAVIKNATEFIWDNIDDKNKNDFINKALNQKSLVYINPDLELKHKDVVVVPYGENEYTGVVIQKHTDPLDPKIKNKCKIIIKKKN